MIKIGDSKTLWNEKKGENWVRRSYIFLSLFIVLNILLSGEGVAQRKEYNFNHIGTRQGLSHSNVVSILQDRKGFMWFGTRDGLNKYDAYTITIYKNILNDSTSISGNIIRDILEDRDGFLWLATTSGLNKFNPATNQFTRYKSSNKIHSLVSDKIETLFEDSDGDIWIGTNNGLNLLNKKTNTITLFSHSDENKNSLSGNGIADIQEDRLGKLWIGTTTGLDLFDKDKNEFIHYQLSESTSQVECIFEDKKGDLWVGTKNGGLFLLDREKDTFINFRNDPDRQSSLNNNSILSLSEDADGRLWIGTENGGINVYDKQYNIFYHYQKNENDPKGLASNSVHSLYKDRQNNMWYGTFSAGLGFCDWNGKKFNNFISNTCTPDGLNNNNVRRFAEDETGNIWIATDGGGINVFNPQSRKFYYYKENRNSSNHLGGNHIISLILDREKNVWIANYGNGVTFLNRKTGKFTHYKNEVNNPESLSANQTFGIYEDHLGDIWVATYGSGLNKLDRKTNKFTRFLHDSGDPKSLSDNRVLVLYEDKKNNLWIGLEQEGLDLLKRQDNSFLNFSHSDNNTKSISNNLIAAMHEDKKGSLWVATFGALNKYDYSANTFEVFRESEGIPSNTPKSIEEDDHGNLWIGTNKGLINFDPTAKTSKIYTINNGLEGDEFQFSSSLRSSTGEMYFGTNNGFCVFHPDSIKDNPNVPPVYLTNFEIFNHPVKIGTQSPLKKHINEVKEIDLSYTQSVFSFEFAALNFSSAQENKYAYKMEGFDNTWNFVGNKRSATYTNLDPGVYTFKVKAANNDGVWNEVGTSVKVTITPPYWLTLWFKVLLGLTVSAAAFTFYKVRINTVKKQKEILGERNIELNRINDQLQKSNIELDNYVYRASHDLRAPLTSLLGLINLAKLENNNPSQENYIHLMEKSINKMDTFIRNIIDYSRNARIEVSKTDVNFEALIYEIFDDLHYMEGAAEIKKNIKIDQNSLFYSDLFRLKIILNNLISNSIKYRNRNTASFIDIRIETNNGNAVIEISDNGLGIDEESIDKIFNMFYRASQENVGSGLGLYIVKEVITILKGTIDVKSEVGKGATFYITLPQIPVNVEGGE